MLNGSWKFREFVGKKTRYIKDPFTPYRCVNCAQTVPKPENKWSSLGLIKVTAETRILPTDMLNCVSHVKLALNLFHIALHMIHAVQKTNDICLHSAMSCQERKTEPLMKSTVFSSQTVFSFAKILHIESQEPR